MSLISVEKNKSESLEIELDSNVDIALDEGANLVLKILGEKTVENCKITANLNLNSEILIVFADFIDSDFNCKVDVNLNGKGACGRWELSSISDADHKKKFDVSFIHNAPNTFASMQNYGVAKDKSRLVFTGVNHIKNGMVKSDSSQSAKIILFDEFSYGEASPILKIDENDVVAKHAAVVGQLSHDHLYYLMSRGLTPKEAKSIITLGYISPIKQYFSDEKKARIDELIFNRI